MAAGLPAMSPLWRSSLRIWLSTTLTTGILLWSGRQQQLGLALIMAVLFVNENDVTPVRSIGQQIGAALVGILTAMVLQQLSNSWVVLGIALLVTGILVRGLGLLKGLGSGYLGCWGMELMHRGHQFNWALVFDMAFAVVVGILMAQIATWALWPRQPLQQLPGLEAVIVSRLAQQISSMQRWLRTGGPAPPLLHSQDLLPQIQQLQQLRQAPPSRTGSSGNTTLFKRWAQSGSLLRQILRQWLLLEPLLRELQAPLPQPARAGQAWLPDQLQDLLGQLQGQAHPAPRPSGSSSADAEIWLEQATALGASKPLLLAIGQQCQAIEQLLQARALLHRWLAQHAEPRR